MVRPIIQPAIPTPATHAIAAETGTASSVAPGEIRARLITLESSRLVIGHFDKSTPPRRVYSLTREGARIVEP